MERMFKINDLGLAFEIGIVATTLFNDIPHVIYTDFTSDLNGDLKLYVGRLGKNKEIYDVPVEVFQSVLKEFREEEKNYLNVEREENE